MYAFYFQISDEPLSKEQTNALALFKKTNGLISTSKSITNSNGKNMHELINEAAIKIGAPRKKVYVSINN